MKIKDQRSDIFSEKVTDIKQWFVLYIKSRHEKVAKELLIEAGFTVYLPIRKVLKEWSQRKKWVEEPVFKSYIFIKTYKKQLVNALVVDNVISYIRFAGEPAVVREESLLLVKKMLLNETTFEVQSGVLKPGNEITIKTGSFKGSTGIIKELRGKKKFVVQLKTLNMSLVIPLSDMIPPED